MPQFRATRTLGLAAAALLVAASPAAAAFAPTAEIGGRVTPNYGRPGTPLRFTMTFRLDPGPTDPFMPTPNRVDLQFPGTSVVRMNGNLFPSCSADTINRARGFTRCPAGSQIGSGSLRGDVPNLDLTNVPGRVTLFNGPGGKSITVHIHLTNPALIKIAFAAPITRTSGRYGYTIRAPVPQELQTLIEPDSFSALRVFTTTVGITRRIGGRTRGYIEGMRCPSSGSAPIAGQFYFNQENSQTSATGEVRCRPA